MNEKYKNRAATDLPNDDENAVSIPNADELFKTLRGGIKKANVLKLDGIPDENQIPFIKPENEKSDDFSQESSSHRALSPKSARELFEAINRPKKANVLRLGEDDFDDDYASNTSKQEKSGFNGKNSNEQNLQEQAAEPLYNAPDDHNKNNILFPSPHEKIGLVNEIPVQSNINERNNKTEDNYYNNDSADMDNGTDKNALNKNEALIKADKLDKLISLLDVQNIEFEDFSMDEEESIMQKPEEFLPPEKKAAEYMDYISQNRKVSILPTPADVENGDMPRAFKFTVEAKEELENNLKNKGKQKKQETKKESSHNPALDVLAGLEAMGTKDTVDIASSKTNLKSKEFHLNNYINYNNINSDKKNETVKTDSRTRYIELQKAKEVAAAASRIKHIHEASTPRSQNPDRGADGRNYTVNNSTSDNYIAKPPPFNNNVETIPTGPRHNFSPQVNTARVVNENIQMSEHFFNEDMNRQQYSQPIPRMTHNIAHNNTGGNNMSQKTMSNISSSEIISETPVSPEVIRADIQSRKGKIKKRSDRAAIFGGIVFILALLGLISIIVFITNYVRTLMDDSNIRAEFEHFIQPVVLVDIPEFSDASKIENKTMILTGIWNIIFNEPKSKYENDEQSVKIPGTDVEAHIIKLFGEGLRIEHETVGDAEVTFDFDSQTNRYIVPATLNLTSYEPRVEGISKSGDLYKLNVSYIPKSSLWNNDVQVSNNETEPFKHMIYSLIKKPDGNYIISAVNIDPEY